MRSLIARCPKTKMAIDTGIGSDYKSLAKSWAKNVVVRCPHCNEEHTMKVREIYVKNEISDLILGREVDASAQRLLGAKS